MLYIIATFLNLLTLVFCPNIWSILENALCVCKNVYSTASGWNGLYMSVRSWCFQNSLCLGFLSFNIMWLNKILFELKLSVDLWASWPWMSISLHRFGEFSAIIPLNKLAVVFSLFSFWDSQNVNSFTWWSPIIHIGFLHSFSSFCSPLNNFKWSVFEFTNPFFCLITCSADSLYYILNFIHCILKP